MVNYDPFNVLQEVRSFPTFRFSRQTDRETTSVDVALLVTYAVAMIFLIAIFVF